MRRYFRWWGEILTPANYHLLKGSSFFKLGLLKERFEWNLKEGTNVFFTRYKGVISRSWKQSLFSLLFTNEIWRLTNLCRISTFFRHPSVKFLQIVLCFILGLVLFRKKDVWIFSKALIMWLGTVAIRAWKTISDIAKHSKTTVLPSRVRFRNHQTFSTVCTSETTLRKLGSFFIVLLYEKLLPKVLITSLNRSMHFISQTANWTTFGDPIPAISHFVRTGFNPEKKSKYWIVHPEVFRKKVVLRYLSFWSWKLTTKKFFRRGSL